MQHIANVPPEDIQPGENPWLMDSPFNDWAVRLVRFTGRTALEARGTADTYFFVTSGEAEAFLDGAQHALPRDATLFLPAGARAEIAGLPQADILEIVARKPAPDGTGAARVLLVDEKRFDGEGFAYQTLADRARGSTGLKLNILRVTPGSGSPDFHIHVFDQIYFILEGEMQIDIGRRTYTAGANSLVYIPAGIVHRNYNIGSGIERHISLLVPEPRDGEILDYATTIHEREAEIMAAAPDTAIARRA